MQVNYVQRAAAIEELFVCGAIAFESLGATTTIDLHPLEHLCVATAVESRVREFAAGRRCARAGLRELGAHTGPIVNGRDRAPIWPPGIVGSIAHTGEYCVAVVGPDSRFAAIGIDAERLGVITKPLWPLTLHDQELAALTHLDDVAAARTATMIFAAKEAFYKCQFGLTRAWIGFEEVVVSVSGDAFDVALVAESAKRLPKLPFKGRFLVTSDLVIAGVSIDRVALGGSL